MLWATKNILNLGSFSIARISFCVIIASKTWRSSSLGLVKIITSLWNPITWDVLTIICVVVIIRRVDRCSIISKEVVNFLRICYSRSCISTNRSHRKLINLLLWLICNSLVLWFSNNQITSLSSNLSRSICWGSSSLCLLVWIPLSDIYKNFVIVLSGTCLTLYICSIWYILIHGCSFS